MGTRKLKIEIVGDAKGVSSAFREVDRAADRTDSKIGDFAKKGGLALGAFAAGGVAAGVLLAPTILNTGAELEALAIKADTVFGDSLPSVKKWADQNAKSMGLTSDRLVGLTAGMGDLLKPMGFTEGQAASMSMEMTNLAGALSAWSGGQRSASEVSDILSKALLGERDALKGLGISITEEEVQMRLAEKGQKDLTGAALQQAKALATQELILEKSTDAQKAWSDGSMDAIKRQNETKASVEQLKDSLIQGIYPALQGILPFVEKAATWLGENLPKAMEVIKGWVDRNWPTIKAVVTEAVETIRGGIEGFVTFVQDAWAKWGDEITQVVEMVWPRVRDAIAAALEVIRGIIKTVTSLIRGDWSGVWDGIKQIVSGVWDGIKNLVKLSIDSVRLLLSLGLDAIKSIWSGAWDTIKTVVDNIWDGIYDFVSSGISRVVGLVLGIPRRIGTAISGAFDAIKDAFKSAVNWVIDKWNNLSLTLGGGSYDPLGDFGPTITVPSFTISTPNLPRLHSGGVVGGRSFAGMAADEVAAILRRGETVLTPAQVGAVTGGGNTYVLQVEASPGTDRARLGRELIELIQEAERSGGDGWRR